MHASIYKQRWKQIYPLPRNGDQSEYVSLINWGHWYRNIDITAFIDPYYNYCNLQRYVYKYFTLTYWACSNCSSSNRFRCFASLRVVLSSRTSASRLCSFCSSVLLREPKHIQLLHWLAILSIHRKTRWQYKFKYFTNACIDNMSSKKHSDSASDAQSQWFTCKL